MEKVVINKFERNSTVNNLIDYTKPLIDIINECKSIEKDEEMDKFIKRLIQDASEITEKENNIQQQRFEQFNGLLYKCWKVFTVNDITETPVMYLYPYKLLKENDTLFGLCSEIEDPYNMKCGLRECSLNINEDYIAKFDLIFKQVDESEMIEFAKSSCEKAFSGRINKLKYRDKVI